MRFFFKLLALVFRLCGMKYMEKRGTSRFVWIFEKQRFALKFPIFSIKAFVKTIWRSRNDFEFLKLRIFKNKSVLGSHHSGSLEGFFENWSEYVFFQQNHLQSFLLPTHFSFFGLWNVMVIGTEVGITDEELKKIFKSSREDRHHFFNPQNFCLYRGHLCIRDYGSLITQTEISKNWDVLNALTSESIER